MRVRVNPQISKIMCARIKLRDVRQLSNPEHHQGFFQALCYNTVFVFQIEFIKGRSSEKNNRESGC